MINFELAWQELNEKINDLEGMYTESDKRKYGIYWTSLDLAYEIVEDLFSYFDSETITKIETKKLLEPCVGMGSFIFAYLRKLFEIGLNPNSIEKVVNNIYFCDIEEDLLVEFFNCYKCFIKQVWGVDIKKDLLRTNSADGLIYKHNSPEYIGVKEAFGEEILFDIIITNPPYKNLRIDSGHYSDADTYESDKEYYRQLTSRLKPHFSLNHKGTLNLYKLFVEKIITSYCAPGAYISLLVPNTLLADKSSLALREHCLQQMIIKQITNYPESNKLFKGVTQALSNVYLINSKNSSNTIIFKENGKTQATKTEVISRIDENLSLIPHSSEDIKTLLSLSQFPKIGDFDFIKNLRGELDMSLNKKYITKDSKGYSLIKGAAIDKYSLKDMVSEYVDRTFYSKTKKNIYIDSVRIACPQVSNQKTKQRIKFSLINKDNVLANSCNFIYVEDNLIGYDLYYFLGLLNTEIINWYFKKFNSNNHIGNYEIAKFPIHDDIEVIKKISQYAKSYLSTNDASILKEIEQLTAMGFNILSSTELASCDRLDLKDIKDRKKYYKRTVLESESDFERTLKLASDYKKLCVGENILLNNDGYKLSDLDLEMIANIPPGGNWQNIPEAVVKKSKRLMQITKSGGRTTLYGRMDYSKPSYTITTYFNRPGNGTYVHPKLDRVITAREAARLQSFPDEYYFYGNQKEVLLQIGNAVPCKFAEKIGRHIKNIFPDLKTFGDLFSGAGGMSHGLIQSGLQAIFANDISMAACITHKVNHPKTDVIHGSILDEEIKKRIHTYHGQVDILVGGPPCQGFSHAGKRIVDDPRNQLFMEFVSATDALNPKVVLMENVPGFMTLDGGNFLAQAKDLWKQLGYTCEAKIMNTSHFGVPQKRKRVILICVKSELLDEIPVGELFPHPHTLNEEEQFTIYDAISDLEAIEPNTLSKRPNSDSSYLKTLG